MLSGKHILLCVSGSIAAYKACELASLLVKEHGDVRVIMTKDAEQFVSPVTFETLTSNPVLDDVFDRNSGFHVAHIDLAAWADVVMIAPATANIIAKLACGIADDMLTATLLAVTVPVYLAPAMNTHMYENEATRCNLCTLQKRGYHIIEPSCGRLACGDTGRGKLPEPAELLEYLLAETAFPKDMTGKKVLITAGPTQESLDPVRFITNHSTGKMGYAIARNAVRRGADVTLITGPSALPVPAFVTAVPVITAQEMFDAVSAHYASADIIIMTAAVADYTPVAAAPEKIKKTEDLLTLSLKRTKDILGMVGSSKNKQFLCGFSMETENLLEHSKEKLQRKNLDLIVANSLRTEGAGFGTDTNVVTLITKDLVKQLPLLRKDEVASAILSQILRML